jgi:hypothetical protein
MITMVTTVHTSRDIDVEELRRTLSDALGTAYQVTVTSRSAVKVHHNAMTAIVQVAPSGAGTDLRVSSVGLFGSGVLNSLTITPRVRHALESIFPEQAELRRAYRWG